MEVRRFLFFRFPSFDSTLFSRGRDKRIKAIPTVSEYAYKLKRRRMMCLLQPRRRPGIELDVGLLPSRLVILLIREGNTVLTDYRCVVQLSSVDDSKPSSFATSHKYNSTNCSFSTEVFANQAAFAEFYATSVRPSLTISAPRTLTNKLVTSRLIGHYSNRLHAES